MNKSGEARRIAALVDDEVAAFVPRGRSEAITLRDFQAARTSPRPVFVQFSGGIVQTCWTVTRANGPYRVVFMPSAGYFSLCVEGPLGLLDIGVHGAAIDCFASV